MLLGVWSNTINPGTVIALVIAALGIPFALRGRAAKEANERASQARKDASDFRDNYDVERERSESLEKQLLEQREAKHAALTEVGRLKMLTDLTHVLKAIAELRAEISAHFEAFSHALDKFERTQEAQTAVLQAIEKRLTAEN